MSSKNEYGLDVGYFECKLSLVLRDISRYEPHELARELARLSVTADGDVLSEPEFSRTTIIESNTGTINIAL